MQVLSLQRLNHSLSLGDSAGPPSRRRSRRRDAFPSLLGLRVASCAKKSGPRGLARGTQGSNIDLGSKGFPNCERPQSNDACGEISNIFLFVRLAVDVRTWRPLFFFL